MLPGSSRSYGPSDVLRTGQLPSCSLRDPASLLLAIQRGPYSRVHAPAHGCCLRLRPSHFQLLPRPSLAAGTLVVLLPSLRRRSLFPPHHPRECCHGSFVPERTSRRRHRRAGRGGGEVAEDGIVTPPPRSRGLDEEITALIQRRKDLRRERAVVAKAVRKAGADR